MHSKVRVRWSGDETETFTTTYHVMDSSCRSQIERWSDTLTGAYDTADVAPHTRTQISEPRHITQCIDGIAPEATRDHGEC
jgi:hypothetical protein